MNHRIQRRRRLRRYARELHRDAKRARGSHTWAQNRVKASGHPHACAECGRSDVRLYRSYGGFFDKDDVRCNACLTTTAWRVPLVTNPQTGQVWGYTSVPDVDAERFYVAPEADPSRPTWQRIGGWSRNLEGPVHDQG